MNFKKTIILPGPVLLSSNVEANELVPGDPKDNIKRSSGQIRSAQEWYKVNWRALT